MQAPYEPPEPWGRYAHASWTDLTGLIRSTWSACPTADQQAVADGLLAALATLDMRPADWRASLLGTPEPPPEARVEAGRSPLDDALEEAARTAEDGAQRAVEYGAGDLEDLLSLRLEVRNALAASPTDSPLRRVRPWTGDRRALAGR